MSAPAPAPASGSGAGVRSLDAGGAAAAGGSPKPKAKKKEGSVKKKVRSSGGEQEGAARDDPLAPASSLDASLLAARASAAAHAHASAFPALTRPYNPDDDADEEIDEEEMRRQMEEMMKEEEQPPRALTLEMIRQRCLPARLLESGDQDSIDASLLRLSRIHLDGQSLSSLDDCFDLMSHSLTHLYLQRNLLTSSAGLSCLRNLRFLTLASNRIRVLEGVAGLSKLEFLDISDNLIDELDTGAGEDEETEEGAEDTCQLPERLVHLRVRGNPFAENPDCREHIVTVSPYLKFLDGVRITAAMRRSYGLEASDDEAEEATPAAAAPAGGKGARSADDDEAGIRAAYELRAEAEEMKRRSEQRTKMYDSSHGVSAATTKQDRVESLKEAAATAATPVVSKQ